MGTWAVGAASAPFSIPPFALWIVVVVLLVALFGILGQLVRGQLAARRRLASELREIVQVVEDLRSGRARRPGEVDAASPLAPLADAVSRLGHDLHGRWTATESAAERWRALIDASAAMAVITTDTDGDIRSFSGGATALFGWDEDEVLSRPAAVVFEEGAYKDLLPKLARKNLRKQGITAHSRLLRRDGTSFEAEVTVRLLAGANDQPVGFMMVVRDRTEQLRLETELGDSERRYRGLIEGLGEGVVIVRDGLLRYANPAAERLLGRSRAELEGSPLRQAVALADVLVVDELLRAVRERSETAEELRTVLVGPDGVARAAVRLRASAIDYDSGPAVLLHMLDETGERRMQEELARNEARLDAVLEATSDGILVVADAAEGGRVRMSNHAFASLFGLAMEEVLGRPGFELAALLRARGAGGERLAELIVAGGPQAARTTLTLDPSGGALEVTVAQLVGSRGESLGRVLACRDVSEQRRSERQLQAQAERLELGKIELEQSHRRLADVNAKLERRGEELDRLNRELRKLNEMKTNLLGNVSHELQTPLVAIRGYTEMIVRERLGPINEEQRRGLDLSLKNIDRLISMIDGLLDFARGNEDERLALSHFSLRELVEEALDTIASHVNQRRLTVRVEVPADLSIHADRDKILQVLLNLLSNAVKFNREGGSIDVRAERSRPGLASVSVRDTGLGIPEHALGRIFERGYRVERSASDGAEGSGIGLALVHQILRAHGCTIHVESREGSGSDFVFTLPLGTAATEGPMPSDPPASSSGEVTGDDDDRPTASSRPRSSGVPRPRLRIIRRYREDELS